MGSLAVNAKRNLTLLAKERTRALTGSSFLTCAFKSFQGPLLQHEVGFCLKHSQQGKHKSFVGRELTIKMYILKWSALNGSVRSSVNTKQLDYAAHV